jgi:hypothetical protein
MHSTLTVNGNLDEGKRNKLILHHYYDTQSDGHGLTLHIDNGEGWKRRQQILIWSVPDDQAEAIADLFEKNGWINEGYKRASAPAEEEN